MLKRKLLTVTFGILLALALGYGLLRLFAIRWERGDVYPAYSTLRTDPLGTRAFFESIEVLPGINAERNFRELEQVRPSEPVTLIYAGVSHDAVWGQEELRHFESLIANGSRAVFAFGAKELQREKKTKLADETAVKQDKSSPEPEVKQGNPSENHGKERGTRDVEDADEKKEETKQRGLAPTTVKFDEVAERWGFKFDIAKGKRIGSFHGVATAAEGASELEPELSWHTALRFTDLQSPWRVLYRTAGEPVVIERRWGDGTIVLAADSFFLSNEALMNERSPRFLASLLGRSRLVIFDEEHLGVSEDTGLVSLARKYHLQGGAFALVCVGLLWVWRQSVRFVPSHLAARRSEEYVAGLDSHAGFVSLLRRAVPPAKALEVCLEEWRKTFAHDKKALATVDQALADSTPEDPRKAEPAAIYQAVTRALKEHKNPKVKTV